MGKHIGITKANQIVEILGKILDFKSYFKKSKAKKKWQLLQLRSERKRENDKSKWTFWHSRWAVHPGNADECSE